YVHRVCNRLGDGSLLVEASDGEPSEQQLYRIGTRAGAPVVDARRLTSTAGIHVGAGGGDTVVVGALSLDAAGAGGTGLPDGEPVGELANLAAALPYAPRPTLARVTDRRLPTGVLYPRAHVAGRKLPVLVDIYGGPQHQEVLAARSRWQERQWWADAGF